MDLGVVTEGMQYSHAVLLAHGMLVMSSITAGLQVVGQYDDERNAGTNHSLVMSWDYHCTCRCLACCKLW